MAGSGKSLKHIVAIESREAVGTTLLDNVDIGTCIAATAGNDAKRGGLLAVVGLYFTLSIRLRHPSAQASISASPR